MSKLLDLKKYFLYSLIGSLIAAAAVAVVTIMAGSFNDTTSRVLGTLGLVVVHSLVSLILVQRDKKDSVKLDYFTDTLFVLIVMSLITSLLSVWQIITTDLTPKMYAVYTIIAGSALHFNVIYLIRNKGETLSKIVRINFVFVGVVAIMTIPLIFMSQAPDIYARSVASLAVIDVTLTVISAILYKLYLQKHPSEADVYSDGKSSGGVLRILLIIVLSYVAINVALGLIFMLASIVD